MASSVIDRPLSVICTSGYRLGMRPPNYGKKYPAEILSRDEIERLMGAMGRGNAGARNRALTAVMWRSGLRIAECLALEPKDVDLGELTIQVLHGKGDRRRLVGMDPTTGGLIEVWLARRAKLDVPRGRPLFCVISQPTLGKGLHSAYVREMLKDAAVKAGIDKRVHPHGLRHTFASELAKDPGASLHDVQQLLGHSSLATTSRYVHQLSPWQAIDVLRQREWTPSHELGS